MEVPEASAFSPPLPHPCVQPPPPPPKKTTLLARVAGAECLWLPTLTVRCWSGVSGRYTSVWSALVTIGREEGVRRGLYRGLSLNYLKTMPNVAICEFHL